LRDEVERRIAQGEKARHILDGMPWAHDPQRPHSEQPGRGWVGLADDAADADMLRERLVDALLGKQLYLAWCQSDSAYIEAFRRRFSAVRCSDEEIVKFAALRVAQALWGEAHAEQWMENAVAKEAEKEEEEATHLQAVVARIKHVVRLTSEEERALLLALYRDEGNPSDKSLRQAGINSRRKRDKIRRVLEDYS